MNIARNIVLAERDFREFVLKYVKYLPSKSEARDDFIHDATLILNRLQEVTDEYDRRAVPERSGE